MEPAVVKSEDISGRIEHNHHIMKIPDSAVMRKFFLSYVLSTVNKQICNFWKLRDIVVV